MADSVSTQDQNVDLQRTALEQAGCQKIYEDQMSGARAERPGLQLLLEVLREGDTLVVWKLDRLGRSVKHLVDLVSKLSEQSINFRSLTDNIDTTTPGERFFFYIMASLAQMERELNIERTRSGLLAARQQGHLSGRKRLMTDSKIELKPLARGLKHHSQNWIVCRHCPIELQVPLSTALPDSA